MVGSMDIEARHYRYIGDAWLVQPEDYYFRKVGTIPSPKFVHIEARISDVAIMPGLNVHGSDHITSSRTRMEHEKKWVSGFSFDRESMMIAHTGWLWNK